MAPRTCRQGPRQHPRGRAALTPKKKQSCWGYHAVVLYLAKEVQPRPTPGVRALSGHVPCASKDYSSGKPSVLLLHREHDSTSSPFPPGPFSECVTSSKLLLRTGVWLSNGAGRDGKALSLHTTSSETSIRRAPTTTFFGCGLLKVRPNGCDGEEKVVGR